MKVSFVLVLVLFCVGVWAHSDMYYDMVNDINANINYYNLLDIQKGFEIQELRRAYRKLSLKYHPDKNSDPNASEQYMRLARAYEVLTNDVQRQEYDKLLEEGIPWETQYYGRYAHYYGAPEHDIRWVLFWLVIIITIAKHIYGWYNYNNVRRLAMQHPRYKLLAAQRDKAPKEPKKSKNSGDQKSAAADASEVDFVVVGLEKPQWRDLFILQLIRLPITLYNGIRTGMQSTDPDKEMRRRAGMENVTDDEWALEKSKMQQRQERMKQSAKYKRYKRWLNNHTPQYAE